MEFFSSFFFFLGGEGGALLARGLGIEPLLYLRPEKVQTCYPISDLRVTLYTTSQSRSEEYAFPVRVNNIFCLVLCISKQPYLSKQKGYKFCMTLPYSVTPRPQLDHITGLEGQKWDPTQRQWHAIYKESPQGDNLLFSYG